MLLCYYLLDIFVCVKKYVFWWTLSEHKKIKQNFPKATFSVTTLFKSTVCLKGRKGGSMNVYLCRRNTSKFAVGDLFNLVHVCHGFISPTEIVKEKRQDVENYFLNLYYYCKSSFIFSRFTRKEDIEVKFQ